jgi:hypothetical protein
MVRDGTPKERIRARDKIGSRIEGEHSGSSWKEEGRRSQID